MLLAGSFASRHAGNRQCRVVASCHPHALAVGIRILLAKSCGLPSTSRHGLHSQHGQLLSVHNICCTPCQQNHLTMRQRKL